jgi:WD40 repeat protein
MEAILLGVGKGHQHWVHCCKFSHSGKLVSSVAWDKTVRLWSVTDSGLQQERIFSEHTIRLRSCAFNRDDSVVASVSSNGDVRTFQIAGTKSSANRFDATSLESVHFMDMEGSSQELVVCGSYSGQLHWARLHSDADLLQLTSLCSHHTAHDGILFALDSAGSLLATGGLDRNVRFWRAASDASLVPLTTIADAHSAPVRTCAFTPDGKQLLTGGADRLLRLWDLESGSVCVRAFNGHTGWVFSVAISPDMPVVASGAGNPDYGVRLWDLRTAAPICSLVGNKDHVSSVTFTRDGLLCTGAERHQLRLWRVR